MVKLFLFNSERVLIMKTLAIEHEMNVLRIVFCSADSMIFHMVVAGISEKTKENWQWNYKHSLSLTCLTWLFRLGFSRFIWRVSFVLFFLNNNFNIYFFSYILLTYQYVFQPIRARVLSKLFYMKLFKKFVYFQCTILEP